MGWQVRLLDLYSKAGGAAMGYHRAGFEVVGVDIKNQKRFPFEFIQADALEVLEDKAFLASFDVITSSPPCQTHSRTKHLRDAQGGTTTKIDLIPQTRSGLIASGKPYVIENVPGAPLIKPVQFCGSSFGLKVRRHRLFESNLELSGSVCKHKEQGKPIGVYGAMNDTAQGLDKTTGKYVIGGSTAKTIEEAREAMGIDWMIWSELVEAIPPAYTFEIGKQLLGVISETN
jgi:DNA (cytosine-5)-methyltransferase 1